MIHFFDHQIAKPSMIYCNACHKKGAMHAIKDDKFEGNCVH